MPYETMNLSREDGFAVLTLNRPPAAKLVAKAAN